MQNGQEYLTKEKYTELEKELEFLKSDKRKEVATALEYAKSLGDLSENQEYQEARDSQAVLEDRINRLEAILKTAKIVFAHDSNTVSVGSVLVLEKEGSKDKKTYTLVGSEEADAASGKISVKSPLGLAAMGKSKGDKFSYDAPSGKISFKIIDIK